MYAEETFQQIIRDGMEHLRIDKRGLQIYRGTYKSTSQYHWDKFVSMIKQDAQECLEAAKDQDLLGSMEWNIIEGP